MRRDDGSAVVEFALVIPLVILVLIAALELVAVTRLQLEVVHAAREGARQAATNPDVEGAVTAVRASLPEVVASRATVTVERPHTVGASARVSVEVPHRFASVLFGGLAMTVTGRAVMRVER